MPKLAFLMPLVALVLVAAGITGALLVRDGTSSNLNTASAPTAVPTQEAPDAVQRTPGSVCQGVVSRPDPNAPRTFAPQYTKQRETTAGITVVGMAGVDDRALDVAAATIDRVFRDNDLEERLAEEGAYVIVLEPGQEVLQLPEFSCLAGGPVADILSHVCGVADRADYPVATVSQLDLLGNRRGPCGGLNILFHEIGHLVQGWTLAPADYFDIRILYQEALDAGKYRSQYAATNTNEYFAEGTQAFFDNLSVQGGRGRAWLQSYDPDLYELLVSIYEPGGNR
jgi:hypothetical protein